MALAHRVVERHLSDGDISDPAGNGMVLRFGPGGEARADRISAAIHGELGRLLRAAAPSGWELALAHATEHAVLEPVPVFAVSGKRSQMTMGFLPRAILTALAKASGQDVGAPALAEESTLLQMTAAARWLRAEPHGALILPLPFAATSRRLLDRLCALCLAFPETWRERLVFELCGLAAGTPRSRVDDLVRTLAPVCQGVAVELQGAEPAQLACGQAGLFATITAETMLLGGTRAPDAPGKLVRNLDGFGVKLLVKGVASEHALTAVYGASAAWVTGAAVGAGDPGL